MKPKPKKPKEIVEPIGILFGGAVQTNLADLYQNNTPVTLHHRPLKYTPLMAPERTLSMVSNCCGAPAKGIEYGICPECFEPCEFVDESEEANE